MRQPDTAQSPKPRARSVSPRSDILRQMHRRRLLLLSPLLLLTLVPLAHAQPGSRLPLDDGWRFVRQDVAGAAGDVFDDGAWEKVRLPHSWNALDWAAPNSGYYRGVGWYRRTLEVPAAWKGRRVFVRFGAASIVADVFVNGTSVGQHRGAFAAFAFEITTYLRPGGRNTLAVRVTNEKQQEVPPLGGDFNMFGGLYRRAELLVRDSVCITPIDLGSSGVASRQLAVDASRAELSVVTKVSNDDSAAHPVEVLVRVNDARGKTVATTRRTAVVPARDTLAVDQSITVTKPHLWDGVRDPYLHRLVVEVRANGTLVDKAVQPLGFRSITFDPAQGFLLNGRHYAIRGVNRHQDVEGKAWAITEQDMDADMALIREMGVTGIRFAHYQHDDYFYSLCDRFGLVAWAELPLVNGVTYSDAFAANARQQLTELIRQNINHPSIVMWSLYNEVTNGGAALDPTRIIAALQPVAKAEDATRPTVAGTAGGHMLKFKEMTATPDLIAGNFYPGWYEGKVTELGSYLDRYNDAFERRGLAVSEYGAGASAAQHEQGMTAGPKTTGKWHPEEWQAILHETQYADIVKRPFVWGSFVWNMFDFASAGRTEGDRNAINDKGLVTYDRKVRKDAFYFYKANWSTSPVLYVTSRRHTERADAKTDVKVYSNGTKLELKVNGRSRGTTQANGLHVFVWKDVMLAPGENRIEVSGTGPDGKRIKDWCGWMVKQ